MHGDARCQQAGHVDDHELHAGGDAQASKDEGGVLEFAEQEVRSESDVCKIFERFSRMVQGVHGRSRRLAWWPFQQAFNMVWCGKIPK